MSLMIRKNGTKKKCGLKANPGLGPIKKVEFLRDCVNKAKSDPAFKATVMVKDFNMKEKLSISMVTLG